MGLNATRSTCGNGSLYIIAWSGRGNCWSDNFLQFRCRGRITWWNFLQHHRWKLFRGVWILGIFLKRISKREKPWCTCRIRLLQRNPKIGWRSVKDTISFNIDCSGPKHYTGTSTRTYKHNNKCNKQFWLSLAEISILNTTIFSFSIDMEISKQEKNQNIKLYLLFHGKNFTPTSVTLGKF